MLISLLTQLNFSVKVLADWMIRAETDSVGDKKKNKIQNITPQNETQCTDMEFQVLYEHEGKILGRTVMQGFHYYL